jgi:hypothetical protein
VPQVYNLDGYPVLLANLAPNIKFDFRMVQK